MRYPFRFTARLSDSSSAATADQVIRLLLLDSPTAAIVAGATGATVSAREVVSTTLNRKGTYCTRLAAVPTTRDEIVKVSFVPHQLRMNGNVAPVVAELVTSDPERFRRILFFAKVSELDAPSIAIAFVTLESMAFCRIQLFVASRSQTPVWRLL